jgi:hypothetical protein
MANDIQTISPGSTQIPYQEFTYTIPVSGYVDVLQVFNYFRVLSLDVSTLSIQVGQNGLVTKYTGAGVGVNFDNTYDRIRLINNGGAPITLTIAIAIGDINDDRLNVSGTINTNAISNSVLTTTADVVVGAAALTALKAANTSRKGIILTNVGANVIRIGDSVNTGAARGAPLLANQSITLETTAAVSGFSTLGTTIAILEY